MIPFTNELGLRDYRPSPITAVSSPPHPGRWPWLVLVLCLVVGLALRVLG